ncbi:MAG: TIGR02302 family protein [Alphaproteobacteria bacterium]
MTNTGPAPPSIQPPAIPGLGRRVAVARLALIWEAVWQSLWQAASALAVYLALSLFDVWRLVPAPLHWLALLALFVFSAAMVYRARGNIRLPARAGLLARIERDNGLQHHPLRALEDRQELGSQNADAQLLWRRHLLRLRQTLPRLRFVLPHPQAIRRDRHGLRLMAGIVLLAGFLAAGQQSWPRLKAGFNPEGIGSTPPNSRLEAWITPPAYTGAAPIMLAGAALTFAPQASPPPPGNVAGSGNPLRVPAGSELTLRLFGGRGAELFLIPETGKNRRAPMVKIDNANSHATIRLEQSQRVQLRQSGADNQEWPITVIPDQPPVISLLEDIAVTKLFSLRIKYGASDDYGVVTAAAEITPVTASGAPPVTPLRIAFPDPLRAAKNGQIAYVDLSAHPWAGRPARLRLIAADAVGQTGRSQPVDLVLPQRAFRNPLARAIIEQRRDVAENDSRDSHAIQALDALSLYPEKLAPDLKIYLALRTARHGVKHLHGISGARQRTADLLWRLAQGIEDGDLSIAGNELRALQNALMQALGDGASDAEISRLTQALREALERYVQAMGEEAQEDATPEANNEQDASGKVSKTDLDALLDQIEQLSRSGSREAAKEMLSRLQDVLENMRPGQAGGQQSVTQKRYGDALRDLSRMMRQQQQLRDETYQQQQGGAQGKGGLARNQDKLRGALDDLKGQLAEGGNKDTPSALDRAGQAMGDAVKSLRKGETGEALQQQGQAMDQLRAGAGALAKLLREEDARKQVEEGEGGENAPSRLETDPLGRPMASDADGTAAIPEQFDIERALQIRRELEQRASERRRPPEELKYIDRLLKLF